MTSEYRIPAPLQNTIDNLAFLASTDDGEKLFFKERMHINKTDWGARVRRYYYNETLESQKKIIKEIIDLGLDSLKSYKKNVHYNRLVTEFKKAKDGLSNLRNTYLKEGREVQDLDNYIYVMENQINALDQEFEEKREEKFKKDLAEVQRQNKMIDEKIKLETTATSNTSPSSNTTPSPNMNNSEHFHFEQGTEEEYQNEQNNNTNNNTNNNANNYLLNMDELKADDFDESDRENKFNAAYNKNNNTKAKTKSKSIPIRSRPELQEYMNRNKMD